MKHIIKDIIEDQAGIKMPKNVVWRNIPDSFIQTEMIVVITGVRRCGKSVLLQQIRSQSPQNDYFFNFDDDRLSAFSQENFQDLYEAFVELYGDEDYFFFDEIQNVNGWEHFVKRLYNMGKKVYVTGSNAKMLSRELGTLLTGCYVSHELLPFSFKEYLSFSGVKIDDKGIRGTQQRALVAARMDEYLQTGGFPLYLLTKDDLVLKTLYDNILYRDIMVRNSLTNEKELKEMVYYSISNIGKPVTYTSLAKIMGAKNPTTAKNYLDYVENTYLLFTITKMDYSVKAQLRNPKKIYCIDNALTLRMGFRMSKDAGRLLENMVFLELRRRKCDIYYHNDGTHECDFVVRDGFSVSAAYQVCYQMENVLTREREINGLLSALETFHLDEGWLITASEAEEIVVGQKKIHIVPCWQWMLE